MENKPDAQNGTSIEGTNLVIAQPQKESKLYGELTEFVLKQNFPNLFVPETLFLATMAGFGLMVGFGSGISLEKKKDEKAFTQV